MTDRAHAAPLAGRAALVLGLGRFDGGVGTVRFLAREGASVLVSDAASQEDLREGVAAIEGTGARLRFGPQEPSLLDEVPRDALVVANPAIPFDHPVLVEAARRGLETTTEVALFLERCPAPVLAVTGTKGKSTTATLLARMVAATGARTFLGGNLGRSLLDIVHDLDAHDAVVLELSSFQLHWLSRAHFRPRIAVVTNLFPDHLDRHGTFAAYAAAKRALLDAQRPDDVAVLPFDDEALAANGFESAGAARRVRFGEAADGAALDVDGVVLAPDGSLRDARGDGGCALEGFTLWGRHNRRNAAAAAAAARAAGATWAEVRAGAAATRALPHRLEPVVEAGGVLYVDDSIATTPQSVAAALEAVPRPCVVLVGGKDKGADLGPLLAALAARAKAVVGIGTTGPAVVAALATRGGPRAVLGGHDMDAAVAAARALAAPGDAVLLSPGFSSLDRYPSFAARGDAFARAARAARATPGAARHHG